MKILKILLLPISFLYGSIMSVRNFLFYCKILRSRSFNIPVISVGNLSFGGTGKTPHIEYLIRLLKDKYSVAALSRGYGRKTKEFVLASENLSPCKIGDEPLQYKTKFKDSIVVAVDEKRKRGIKILFNKFPKLEAILLDDAFQHRWVKPGLSILLTDFHRLYCNNFPLPSGTLREFRSGAKRADIIIVTKVTSALSPITRRRLTKIIKPKEHQALYFSYIKYGVLQSIHSEDTIPNSRKISTILLFSGIANSYPLQDKLRKKCNELIVMNFKDHHKYSIKDLTKIKNKFEDIYTKNKIIITTEKDAMRLSKPELIKFAKDLPIYYLPIEVKLHKDDAKEFDKKIIDYVKKNKRND